MILTLCKNRRPDLVIKPDGLLADNIVDYKLLTIGEDRMKKVLLMPVLAAALFAGACSEDGSPIIVVPSASVRFFNATTEMTGRGGFTTNGQFATGSALAFGQSTQTCSNVKAGSTSFGFGAANTGGTGLGGNALATLENQSITEGGNYTVAAMGSATSPQLFLFANTFSGTLGTNQAAVRFVNLVPGAATPSNNFFVIKGAFGGPMVHSNIAPGVATTFEIVSSGANAYTITRGHQTVISGSDATIDLSAGTINTMAIVPNTSGGFQLINIPRC